MVTMRSPFWGYNTTKVALNGEDLSCCSNKIESVSLRKCPHDHWLTNKAYLSAITVTNITQSFTYKMAEKIDWHRYETKLCHCHPVMKYSKLRLCWTSSGWAGPAGAECRRWPTSRDQLYCQSSSPAATLWGKTPPAPTPQRQQFKKYSLFKSWDLNLTVPSVLWRCWLGDRKGIRPVKRER